MKRKIMIAGLSVEDLLLLFLLILVISVAFAMLRPFLDAIFIAGLFAVLGNPVHQRLLSLLGARPSLAAFLSAVLLTVLVVVPCILIVWRVWQETISIFQAIAQWLDSSSFFEFMEKPEVTRIANAVNRFVAEFSRLTAEKTGQNIQISQMAAGIVESMAKQLANQGSQILFHAASLFAKLVLMVFVFFFIIRDQEQLRRTIFRVLPFAQRREDVICQKVVNITMSLFLGIFLTALAQGLGAGIAFWLTGIPVISGVVATSLASLIPIVGTSVVWLPATLYLVFTDHIGLAILLSVWWAVVVVFLMDNLLRPFLMSGGMELSMPLVFLFILGGIYLFGVLGVLYGPAILSVIYILINLYDKNIATPEIKLSGMMDEGQQ